MLELGQAQQLTVKGALLATLDLACVRVTLARVDAAHVATKCLTCCEVFVARIAMELNRSHSCLVYTRLLRRLRLANDFLTTLLDSHLLIKSLLLDLLQALNQLHLFADTSLSRSCLCGHRYELPIDRIRLF